MSPLVIALIVVLGFVAGQLLLLRPSPREQRLMVLRASARRLGLNPRLVAPPDWYHGPRPSGGLLACYSLLLGDDEPGLPHFRAVRMEEGRWEQHAGPTGILARLSLPAEAEALVALETRANAVSLWWTEPLGEEALPALLELLRQLRHKVH